MQYHLATCAALRVRQLSFGPEMAIGDDRPAGGGTGVLQSTDGTARNFPLPQTGPIVAASETPPHTNTLALQRLSRWLIRPASVHSLASLESRHMGAGLPLRNPLQPVASPLAQDQVAEASSPI